MKGIKKKDSEAVAFGREGGRRRAEKLSKEELSAQARRAVEARWGRPAGKVTTTGKAQAAIDRIRARAKSLQLGPFNWESLKADRDAGRW